MVNSFLLTSCTCVVFLCAAELPWVDSGERQTVSPLCLQSTCLQLCNYWGFNSSKPGVCSSLIFPKTKLILCIAFLLSVIHLFCCPMPFRLECLPLYYTYKYTQHYNRSLSREKHRQILTNRTYVDLWLSCRYMKFSMVVQCQSIMKWIQLFCHSYRWTTLIILCCAASIQWDWSYQGR